jgi:hypothetical protein
MLDDVSVTHPNKAIIQKANSFRFGWGLLDCMVQATSRPNKTSNFDNSLPIAEGLLWGALEAKADV